MRPLASREEGVAFDLWASLRVRNTFLDVQADGGERAPEPGSAPRSSRTRTTGDEALAALAGSSSAPGATPEQAWLDVRPQKPESDAANAACDEETEEQFMERVGLSGEQMLADALQRPDHWSLREQPTSQARSHAAGSCVPCYFHFQSECLFGEKCGCCHDESHRNYDSMRRFFRSSKIQL
eukprot:g28081.t1